MLTRFGRASDLNSTVKGTRVLWASPGVYILIDHSISSLNVSLSSGILKATLAWNPVGSPRSELWLCFRLGRERHCNVFSAQDPYSACIIRNVLFSLYLVFLWLRKCHFEIVSNKCIFVHQHLNGWWNSSELEQEAPVSQWQLNMCPSYSNASHLSSKPHNSLGSEIEEIIDAVLLMLWLHSMLVSRDP